MLFCSSSPSAITAVTFANISQTAGLHGSLYGAPETGHSATMESATSNKLHASVADPSSSDWESGGALEELADGEHVTLVPAAHGRWTNSIRKKRRRTAVDASRPLLASLPGQQHPPALFTASVPRLLAPRRSGRLGTASSWFAWPWLRSCDEPGPAIHGFIVDFAIANAVIHIP